MEWLMYIEKSYYNESSVILDLLFQGWYVISGSNDRRFCWHRCWQHHPILTICPYLLNIKATAQLCHECIKAVLIWNTFIRCFNEPMVVWVFLTNLIGWIVIRGSMIQKYQISTFVKPSHSISTLFISARLWIFYNRYSKFFMLEDLPTVIGL